MKCQKCGKNEVNFHYTSNINGAVTQTYLCAECAAKSGYDFGKMFDFRNIFDDFAPMFGSRNTFMPIPFIGLNSLYPFTVRPQVYIQAPDCENGTCKGECSMPAPEGTAAGVDPEMKKRREINILREQMNAAAANEDFEKAAQLRDQIKEMI